MNDTNAMVKEAGLQSVLSDLDAQIAELREFASMKLDALLPPAPASPGMKLDPTPGGDSYLITKARDMSVAVGDLRRLIGSVQL